MFNLQYLFFIFKWNVYSLSCYTIIKHNTHLNIVQDVFYYFLIMLTAWATRALAREDKFC